MEALAPADYSPVLTVVPVVHLRVTFAHSRYDYIATTLAGRHIVFPAASDGSCVIRERDKMLFSLPEKCLLYRAARLVPGMAADNLTLTALEALAVVAEESNSAVGNKPVAGPDAGWEQCSLEHQALMLWFACLGSHLVRESQEIVDLEPWRAKVATLRHKRAAPEPAAEDAAVPERPLKKLRVGTEAEASV